MAQVLISSARQKVALLGKEGYVSRVSTYSKINGDEFIEFAALNSGINEGQLRASMAAIKQQFQNFLLTGHSVELPGVGIFRLGVNSKMVDTAEDVSTRQIYRRKVIFRASTKIKQLLDQVSFSTSGEMAADIEEGDGEGDQNLVDSAQNGTTTNGNQPGGTTGDQTNGSTTGDPSGSTTNPPTGGNTNPGPDSGDDGFSV